MSSKPPQRPTSGPVVNPALVLLLLLGGCAFAVQKGQVSRRFSSVFGCSASDVRRVEGGYRVEGCGRVAHFRCFDTDDDSDEHADEHAIGRGGLFLGALDAALDADGETCIMEHTEKYAQAPRLQVTPTVVAQRARETEVKTRVLVAGGHLRAVGQPRRYPEQALLSLHSIARFEEPCTAALYLDGAELPIERLERASDREVRLLVRVEHLAALHRAVRFAGSVCGREFELDQYGRESLSLFAARFREEVARGARLAQGTPASAP